MINIITELACYLLILAASFFNALMDAFENENFNESIFRKWNRKFWYKRESWAVARRVFGYKIDGWHLAKSSMIICLLLAVALCRLNHQWWVIILTGGGVWNFGFWLFYHKIFKVK